MGKKLESSMRSLLDITDYVLEDNQVRSITKLFFSTVDAYQ